MADQPNDMHARLGIDINDDPVNLIESIYQIWWHWADFELYVVSPTISPVFPPILIKPEISVNTKELEFVYNIYDHGYKLTTSKAEDMFTAGMSMYKLFNTIEKMIYLLIERLRSGGIDEETEVQIAFGGHQIAQRKAFESVINLAYNVVVTNFDPGEWGERYLATVRRIADKGYGYPTSAPRDARHVPNEKPTLRTR